MAKTMKIKAIIFDVDGLMADTELYQCESIAKMMSSYGVELTHSDLVNMVGVSTKNNFMDIKKKYGIKRGLKRLLAEREKLYIKIIKASGIKAFPGLLDVFLYAKKNGLKIAVGTSSIRTQIDVVVPLLIRSIGVKLPYRKYFNAIVTGSDVKNTKPAPDIFILAAKKLRLLPSECLVLEDSVSGVKAAKSAKMFCIAVKNRYSKNHDLSSADLQRRNLKEVLKTLIKIRKKEEKSEK
jgi:beta-phosphoglucomutase-like phosphatase (HAD superfamily)